MKLELRQRMDSPSTRPWPQPRWMRHDCWVFRIALVRWNLAKDGDVVLYDGDPFEYTSHVVGVVIQGEVVSQEPR